MVGASSKKFSNVGRGRFSDTLRGMRNNISSARFSLQPLRPRVRAALLRIAAGERIHPEIVRINLASCVKAACLKAVVFTMPSKQKGLRMQSSDIFLGDPGLGKGLGAEWREDLLFSSKRMLQDYADSEIRASKLPLIGPLNEGHVDRVRERNVFKDVEGKERIADMALPFLIDLPNGSCEAVFLTASRNRGCGVIPIMEYLKDKQTIIDKNGSNGVFLESHDMTMRAMAYKTTESVPRIRNNTVFWQIYINLEDTLDWFSTAGNNGTARRLCYSYGDSSGMDDIPVQNCSAITEELSKRLLVMFTIFREAHPSSLKFVFHNPNQLLHNVVEEDMQQILQNNELTNTHMDAVFDGSGRANVLVGNAKLIILRNYAQEIAENTFSEGDSSINQLAKNLRSLIGQKAAEMNLLANLITRNSQELREYYHNIFHQHAGLQELSRVDITEAVESVSRSRKIYVAYLEAAEYENNFATGNKHMSKIFAPPACGNLSPIRKVLIFTLHYVKNRKSESKSVKQFLKKNITFKAFAEDLDEVLNKLIQLGVLSIVIREDRTKRNANGEVIVRRKRYFQTLYDNENIEHKNFLRDFQRVYPGQSIISN